MVDKLR